MANPVTRIIITAVDRTKAAFASAKGGLASLRDSALSLSGMLGGIFTGLSVVAFVGQIKKAIDSMDDARKSAQAAGTSVENFTALRFAGDQSGVADMEKSLVALADSLDAARAGTGPAAEAFSALRIDPTQFTDSSDALDALADRFSAMPDGVEKTSLAIDLFGKRIGPQMIPLLNQGSAGIRSLKDEAAALGVVFSGEAAAAAEQFNDSMDKLSNASTGLGINMANEILPGLNKITSAMVEAAKEGSVLKTLWVGLGGLGAGLFTDDLLTNAQKLEKTQRQLNEALADGFEEEHAWVREMRASILVLKNKVAAEEAAAAAEKKTASEKERYTAASKEANAELKKSTEEQISDAERLQAALQSAFSASIRAETDYLRQAKKLREDANKGTIGDDAESQATAALDATISAMRLQREAGTASLENVQDQADALRDLAQQLDNVALRQDLIKQANLAEAGALERAAAEERDRYKGIADAQKASADESAKLKEQLDGIGKGATVDLKPGPGIAQAKQELQDILELLDRIGDKPLAVGVSVSGSSAQMADTLRAEALKYGRR